MTVERVQVPAGAAAWSLLVRTADGTPAVLKLARPGRAGERGAALAHWGGLGAVRLLEPAPGAAEGVLLLERLHPDVSCGHCRRRRRCWRRRGRCAGSGGPAGGARFETVAERTGGRPGHAGERGGRPGGGSAVEAALTAREEGCWRAARAGSLHGTFRQSKVLSGERMPWLAVGPDPVVGEHAFDLARAVRDRWRTSSRRRRGRRRRGRRVKRLAESLEVSRERAAGVDAVPGGGVSGVCGPAAWAGSGTRNSSWSSRAGSSRVDRAAGDAAQLTGGPPMPVRVGGDVAVHTEPGRPSPVRAPGTRVTDVPGQHIQDLFPLRGLRRTSAPWSVGAGRRRSDPEETAAALFKVTGDRAGAALHDQPGPAGAPVGSPAAPADRPAHGLPARAGQS
ncbi:hypothetical protein GCM10023238_04500 [Streptomyces heliomycini]